MSAPDETPLLARAQAGDVAAFEALVERHQARVFGLGVRMLGSKEDAADITQEAFLQAYRHLKDFRADSAFGTWVYRIAANEALMRLRHRKVSANLELPEPQFSPRGSLLDTVADWAPNAEGQALDTELRAAIEGATNTLPEEYRQVFVLRDLEGLSYDEIASLLETTVSTIKSRLHRARLALRAAIDQFYAEREG